VPRLVNILAHKAMLSAFGKEANVVSMFDVLDAANDTDSLRKSNWVRATQLFLLLLIGSIIAYLGWMYLQ
jgi:MSHA biogenesis protein MshM